MRCCNYLQHVIHHVNHSIFLITKYVQSFVPETMANKRAQWAAAFQTCDNNLTKETQRSICIYLGLPPTYQTLGKATESKLFTKDNGAQIQN